MKAVLNKVDTKVAESDLDYRPSTTVPPPPLPPPFQFPYYHPLPISTTTESIQNEGKNFRIILPLEISLIFSTFSILETKYNAYEFEGIIFESFSFLNANFNFLESIAEGYDPTDQIESIDMDMSDDDIIEKRGLILDTIYDTLKKTTFLDLLGTPVEDELPEEEIQDDETLDQTHEIDKSALLETPQQYFSESEEWSQTPPQYKPHNPFQQPRYPLYPNQPNNFPSPSMAMRQPFTSPQNPRQGFQQRNFHPNFRQSSNFRGVNMRGAPYFQKGGPRGGNFNGMGGNRGNFNRGGRGNFRGGPRW